MYIDKCSVLICTHFFVYAANKKIIIRAVISSYNDTDAELTNCQDLNTISLHLYKIYSSFVAT